MSNTDPLAARCARSVPVPPLFKRLWRTRACARGGSQMSQRNGLHEGHPIWHHPIWMDIRPNLDPASETPLYRQLASFIQDLVRTGRLSVGDRLPPTRDLAGQLGLNRTTVSAAYEVLEAEGLITGQVGRGSF